MEAQKKRQIIIIGPDNLGNQMLVYSIENELMLPCGIYPHPLHDFPDNSPSELTALPFTETENLFLIDCSGRELENTIQEIISNPVLSDYKIAFYNLSSSSDVEAKALTKNVRGFFYVSDKKELFFKGVKAIFHGEVWISREILLRHVMSNPHGASDMQKLSISLTSREQQILSLVSIGVRNEEIAAKLSISSNTVKTHMYNIFKKIQVTNRLQAALWAAKNL